MGFVIKQLIEAGLVHEDVRTVVGEGLSAYATEPKLGSDGQVVREPAPEKSGDEKVLTGWRKPFQPDGGIRVLSGNMGAAIIKVSAVKPERWLIEAPALVFNDQLELQDAFKAGKLDNGPIARLKDGDMIRLDANDGTLTILVNEQEFNNRPIEHPDLSANEFGTGRELFRVFREFVGRADQGASVVVGPMRK